MNVQGMNVQCAFLVNILRSEIDAPSLLANLNINLPGKNHVTHIMNPFHTWVEASRKTNDILTLNSVAIVLKFELG